MPGNLFNINRYFNKTSSSDPNSGAIPLDDNNDHKQTQNSSQTTNIQAQTVDNTTPSKTSNEVKQTGPSAQPPKEEKEEDPTVMQKRSSMDILSRLTQRSNKCLIAASGKARELKSQYIDTEHVLWGLLQDSGVYQLISNFKVTPKEVILEVERRLKVENNENQPKFSPRVKKILELSLSYARTLGYEFISPEHILVSLSAEGEGAGAQVLGKFQLTPEKLRSKVGGKEEKGEKEEKTAIVNFTTDLTQMAKEGKLDPVVARSKEIERIMHILSRRTKNNPVLIGDAGVGKTAIVEGLAQRIVASKVPQNLLNKRILALDLMSVIAGASHRGEFEERLKKIISEVKAAKGEIILFIDEIHNIIGAGGGSPGAMDASNILKPALARGEMQTIGISTVSEYRKYIEKDPAFERRFQPVFIKEPSSEEAIEMLTAIKDKYEAYHKVSIPHETIAAAVRLSSRYIGDRFLPDKAIDLVDEGASAVRLPAISLPEEIRNLEEKIKRNEAELAEAQKTKDQLRIATLQKTIQNVKDELKEAQEKFALKKGQTTSVVTAQVIEEIVSNWTGIPISKLTESESAKLVKLEDILHKRLINQEEAVAAVSEAIRRGRAGLSSGKRPIGSFIFLGPTGVGKTELAKALAEALFGSEEMIVRLDMTEYMERHEVAKLIGAPPGYVGYEEGGQLTEAVRRKPYSVVLLDEIEKANPDVFNILLQILDDGRLTDNKGRTINFKNTILICTSNLGTNIIQEELLSQSRVGPLIIKKEEVNTYVVTPTGREMLSGKNSLWEKEDKKVWVKKSLEEYFAGQKVTGADILNPQEKFPIVIFDTHIVSPSGEEEITFQGRIWRRKSTTAKEWESFTLVDYLAKHQVVNAGADNPEDQLPTIKWDTHAISPQEVETITFGNKIWTRINRRSQTWTVGNLSDYVKGGEKALSSSWEMHLFTPNGEEIVVIGKNVYKNVGGAWQSDKLSNLLAGENSPLSLEKEKEEADDKFLEIADKLQEILRKFFRPELLNRFDEITIFRPLTATHMLSIVSLQLQSLGKLLSEQNISFEATENAKEELTLVGFDPVFGARPLRRTIQRLVENPISNMLIKGEVKTGDTITVDFDQTKNEFFFNVQRNVPETEVEKRAEKQADLLVQKTEIQEEKKAEPEKTKVSTPSPVEPIQTTPAPVDNDQVNPPIPSFAEFYAQEKVSSQTSQKPQTSLNV